VYILSDITSIQLSKGTSAYHLVSFCPSCGLKRGISLLTLRTTLSSIHGIYTAATQIKTQNKRVIFSFAAYHMLATTYMQQTYTIFIIYRQGGQSQQLNNPYHTLDPTEPACYAANIYYKG
jgi:hypothetical protein